MYSREQFSLSCERGVLRSFDHQPLSRPGLSNDAVSRPRPRRIPRAFSTPVTAKVSSSGPKVRETAGSQRATKLPRSHRPELPTPATFPRPGPGLTSDPRSGRETAEQGCITAEKLGLAAHIPEQGSAAATAGYIYRHLALWVGPVHHRLLPSFSQLCLDTRPGDISRPC